MLRSNKVGEDNPPRTWTSNVKAQEQQQTKIKKMHSGIVQVHRISQGPNVRTQKRETDRAAALGKEDQLPTRTFKLDDTKSDVFIEEFFAYERLKLGKHVHAYIFFILWGPFGCVLLLLRTILLVLTGLLLWLLPWRIRNAISSTVWVWFLLPMMGIYLSADGMENMPPVGKKPFIVAANHLTNIDPVFARRVCPNNRIACAGHFKHFWELKKAMGLICADSDKHLATVYIYRFLNAVERKKIRDELEAVSIFFIQSLIHLFLA